MFENLSLQLLNTLEPSAVGHPLIRVNPDRAAKGVATESSSYDADGRQLHYTPWTVITSLKTGRDLLRGAASHTAELLKGSSKKLDHNICRDFFVCEDLAEFGDANWYVEFKVSRGYITCLRCNAKSVWTSFNHLKKYINQRL